MLAIRGNDRAGPVEIIFRPGINEPAKIAERIKEYEDEFLSRSSSPSAAMSTK